MVYDYILCTTSEYNMWKKKNFFFNRSFSRSSLTKYPNFLETRQSTEQLSTNRSSAITPGPGKKLIFIEAYT